MKAARTNSLSDALFGKTKKAVIGVLFSRPEREVHLRELARVAGASPTMVGKELDVLVAAGIALERQDGNRRMARANPNCPLFEELRGIARKTMGLGDVLREALQQVDGIDLAFVFGSVARGEEKSHSDVDVFIVGSARHGEVLSALSGVQASVGRPVNPMVYSEVEAREKMREPVGFFAKMLSSDKIFLIGDEDGLEHLARPSAQGRNPRRARMHG